MKKMLVTVCTVDQFKGAPGFHSVKPDHWYLNEALSKAKNSLFPNVFLHFGIFGPTRYKIPYDVLQELFNRKDVDVRFAHPCATPNMLRYWK